jgi:hypothetical protein
MVHLRQSGRRWRRHRQWLKRKRREDRNRALQEGPESARSGAQAASLGSAKGVAMSRPARGTMAHFCRPGWFFRLMRDNFSLVPSDSTTCRQLSAAEKTVAGHGLASGASIASGGLESFVFR